ncbi:MAG: DUF4390 domain-containing protein [Thermodesulfovibrionales bacterium]|nr:DUF4390 domain-containing protein [Thermodesulfovibrionales bacterium]
MNCDKRCVRIKYLILGFLFLLIIYLFYPVCVYSNQVSDVLVMITNSELMISTFFKADNKFIEEISEGVSKELIIYIDLFRVWKIWPDEFVKGRKITRVLKSDPIKREYLFLNIEGNIKTEKRFKDFESMINHAFTVSDIKLANIKELDTGRYFVKVTFESPIKQLPPLVGYLLFFITDKEFSVSKNSQIFIITTDK